MTAEHYLDVVPVDAAGQPLACWLPASRVAAVHLGCGCGWLGRELPIAHEDELSEDAYSDLATLWAASHALVPVG